jgi:hypothetical protein
MVKGSSIAKYSTRGRRKEDDSSTAGFKTIITNIQNKQ